MAVKSENFPGIFLDSRTVPLNKKNNHSDKPQLITQKCSTELSAGTSLETQS